VDVTIPEGSYWKPRHPAALNARNHGIGRVFDLFGGLLGQTNPALLNAAGFSSSPHFMYSGRYSGGERAGEWFQLYSIGFGGIPAARGRKWIDRAGGTREVLPSKCHDVPVAPGDVLHFVTWGGGGWGDPLQRDPALVELEVRRGLVTADGARRYGVVLAGDG